QLGLEPFSLSDLGLSPDEIAGLDAAAPATDQLGLEPFSLSDLGLSPDEIAGLDAAAPATDQLGLEPFSLSDLGLSPDEIAGLSSATAADADEPPLNLAPFSLDELGLDPEPSSPSTDPAAGLTAEPFMWDINTPEGDMGSELGDLQPFSLDDLDLNATSDDQDFGSLPPSLQPFSLDDAAQPSLPRPSSADEQQELAETGVYSWQQPSAKRSTDFLRGEQPEPPKGSIFGRLSKQASERPVEELPPLPPVSDEEAQAAGYFSNDDVSLRDDEPTPTERFAGGFRLPREGEPVEETPSAGLVAGAAAAGGLAAAAAAAAKQKAPPEPPAAEEPVLKPFSLADLGLSPEEIAALEAAQAGDLAATEPEEPVLEPFSLADLGLSPEEIAQLEAANETPAATPEEPAIKPFSLADLGLSPDELAQLEAADKGELPFPVTGETIVPGWSRGEQPELTPFAADEPPASSNDATTGFDDVEPFSFDDFDLEGAAAGTTPAATSAPNEFDDAVAGVEPFSLDDLGLDDLDPTSDPDRQLGVTAEELAGLDLGELESLANESRPTTPLVSEDPAAAMEHLMALGRSQGYVDLTDIISMVSDPEAEAERIEELGWALHNSGIQIRDGDEIIDMEGDLEEEDAEMAAFDEPFASAEPPPVPTLGVDAEPDMTPFSLDDLGLSEDEIEALGLSDTPPPAPTHEADLDAFNFDDFGLTDQPPAAPAAEEPVLEPFSLADLGLSPDEIAALEAAQAGESVAPAPE
ncbi:MAG: RNA polymerase sigma factor region1.1 domain-containing protein, partial [Oscillochloridaceae bacterium umkhey_bin13]